MEFRTGREILVAGSVNVWILAGLRLSADEGVGIEVLVVFEE